ncbi:TOBE domain-containing protein [Marinobacterium arenosum]|uniref:TOBE domain-containing protein n=1 Tax=Marinobacterium arenosum TaxID=2862496 RepID=UPI001C9761D9|nr:TOBE domain-containing protein [Marinobacterium arenosum]MBY4677489.1 TOBE domain-containing protein [Marinobacterium arenosum]
MCTAQAAELLDLQTNKQLAARPESIYIREPGRQYTGNLSPTLSGTVKSSLLLGNVIRYRVDVDGHQLTVDLLNRSSERMAGRGARRELMFSLDEVREVA